MVNLCTDVHADAWCSACEFALTISNYTAKINYWSSLICRQTGSDLTRYILNIFL